MVSGKVAAFAMLCIACTSGSMIEASGVRGSRFLQTATAVPTVVPTDDGDGNTTDTTEEVTSDPTNAPTIGATDAPTDNPTGTPTNSPTPNPTAFPTANPTANPTSAPTPAPTAVPTPNPTRAPIVGTFAPTQSPTPAPTVEPTPNPTRSPVAGTPEPTIDPTFSELDDVRGRDKVNDGDDDGNPSITTWIIIAASVAGGLLCCILGYFVFKSSHRSKDSKGKKPASTKGSDAAEIHVRKYSEDISTLGDPTQGMVHHQNPSQNVFDDDNRSLTTEGLDRMLETNTTYPGASAPRGTAYHSSPAPPPRRKADPGTCFDVRVAPGRVGLILEEVSEDDLPMVHAVKEGSPLEGKVQKGDRLCSLDGIDCTGKSPHSVAQLLKFSENSSSRIMTFCRPSGN